MVLPDSPGVSRAPGYSGYPLLFGRFRVRGSHPLCRSFPAASTILLRAYTGPTTPPQHAGTVWALPLSLATTQGVSIDFLSCGYLDVSVPRVGSAEAVTCLQHAGLPHSEISGSSLVCQLPEAYRRLLRPSSPPSAKASTMRPSMFDLSKSDA